LILTFKATAKDKNRCCNILLDLKQNVTTASGLEGQDQVLVNVAGNLLCSANVCVCVCVCLYCFAALLQTELAAVFRREDVQPQPTSSSASPPAKKPRTSLFAHYSHSVEDSNQHRTPERQLTQYLDTINSPSFDLAGTSIADLVQRKEFSQLHQLFELVLCSPASSAPVERVFSQSGLIMRPHRAKMSDELLEALVFLKCNT